MTTRLSRAKRHQRFKKSVLVFAGPLVVALTLGTAVSVSSSASAAAAALPDLVVTNIVKPAVASGNPVRFTATVKNQGGSATPVGTIIGVGFLVDGAGPVTWSDTDKTSLAPGASVTLTVNAGQVASSWTATAGTHSVRAWVDDVNRIPESNNANNTLTSTFTVSSSVAAPPPPPTTAPPTTLPPTTVPAISAPLPPPPPTGGFKMGISTGSPYGWVTQADVNTMKDLGVSWMRSDITQSNSLAASDSYVNMALHAGINVLGILIPAFSDPASSAAWARIVVAHYAPLGVHTWEWRNESNWMGTMVQPATYAAEIKAAYVAIHQVDPSAVVLEGGSVPAGSLPVNTYLQQLYANGAGGYFDGVAIHPYCGSNCATATWPEIDQMITVHDTMAAHGDAAKRVWADEVGASTYSGAYTEASQAQFLTSLVARLHTLAAQGVAAPMVGWYSERDRPQASVRESHFGLVRSDLSHKPAYATYKTLAAAG